MNRIALIGNGGGGKTTLSHSLQKRYDLLLTHVDSIQYLSGMQTRDSSETSKILNDLADSEKWIIDGFGSMSVMKKRFQLADKVVFVDFPLWRHYWWCTKRQFNSIWRPRKELPEGCNEATLSRTLRLYKILWRVHRQIRPELVTFFSSDEYTGKVHTIRTMQDWNLLFHKGFE